MTDPTRQTETSETPSGAQWVQQAQQEGIEDDGDSSLGDDLASTTASLTSTILHYRTIMGRTFHSERGNAQYWGTNDETQNESMDINHHLLTLCLGGKLHLAPLNKDIQKVVDIGTGTGIWAIDFADEYPDTEVIGTDISPIQPSWVPPNLKFEIEDCTQEWTFADSSLDYVHIRALVGSIVDWNAFFKQAYRCIKPGGFLESYEPSMTLESDDSSVGDNTAMAQWGRFFVEGGKKLGRSFLVVDEGVQKKAMEEAGFVDIQEWNFKAPLGGWAADPKLKEIGQYARITLEQDIEGYVLFMASLIGWTKEEVQVFVAKMRQELTSKKMHPYYRQKVVWGRKPEPA
ncbi:Methyltransferase domain-containing protein [Pleurostoma richardsiae]|uniref:Methyltransferase domain-containing protein n=1 Tax=Pleurostoma richardsiae TaxID=41990 RepID=A0AA38VN45_9PEZI|nr:Methyltransferase domain-containing protein [Pleurostoma richardsiae]